MEAETFQQEATRLRPRLLLLARRYVGCEEESEDIVQDCLLKMWTIRDRLSLPFDALAAAIVRNLCIDRLRSRRFDVDMEDAEGRTTEQDDSQQERIDRVMDIVRTLPDGTFAVVLNRAGWWCCTATREGAPLKGPDGQPSPLKESALFWLYVDAQGK